MTLIGCRCSTDWYWTVYQCLPLFFVDQYNSWNKPPLSVPGYSSWVSPLNIFTTQILAVTTASANNGSSQICTSNIQTVKSPCMSRRVSRHSAPNRTAVQTACSAVLLQDKHTMIRRNVGDCAPLNDTASHSVRHGCENFSSLLPPSVTTNPIQKY